MELSFALDAAHKAAASRTALCIRERWHRLWVVAVGVAIAGFLLRSPSCALLKHWIDLFSSPSTIKPVSIEAGADGKLSQSVVTVGGCGSCSRRCVRVFVFLFGIQLDLVTYFSVERTEHILFLSFS